MSEKNLVKAENIFITHIRNAPEPGALDDLMLRLQALIQLADDQRSTMEPCQLPDEA